MRRLLVLIRHLPQESALSVALHGPSWSVEAHLLDDLRMAWTHSKKHPAKPHPQRPTGKKTKALDPVRIESARRRRRARLAAIERGDIA